MTHEPNTLLPCRKCGSTNSIMWDGYGTQAHLECVDCNNSEHVQVTDLFDHPWPKMDMEAKYDKATISTVCEYLTNEWNTRHPVQQAPASDGRIAAALELAIHYHHFAQTSMLKGEGDMHFEGAMKEIIDALTQPAASEPSAEVAISTPFNREHYIRILSLAYNGAEFVEADRDALEWVCKRLDAMHTALHAAELRGAKLGLEAAGMVAHDCGYYSQAYVDDEPPLQVIHHNTGVWKARDAIRALTPEQVIKDGK